MNLLPGLNWLTALTARRTASIDEDAPDPGDMGTAFGLDAAMAPETPEPPARVKPAPPTADRVVRRPRR